MAQTITTVPSVIQHMITVYKNWYGYRDSFPKKARYALGDRIEKRFILVLELLYTASYQGPKEKLPTLEKTLSGIDVLKFMLRIAWEVHALDNNKYEVLSEGVQNIGKEVGGWRKGLQTKTSGH